MQVSGFCPVLNGNYSINITYRNASTLDEEHYIKGRFCCEHNSFGDKCDQNECPIYKNAPMYK